MHVAEPDEPVALDAVPEKILAAEVHGAHCSLPHAVQPFVRAPEFAEARHLQHERDGAYALKVGLPCGDKIEPHEPKARVADFDNAHERYVVHAVAYRVVIAGRLSADVRHRLAHALAEPDAHLHAARTHAADLDAAVQLAPEVQTTRTGVTNVRVRGSVRSGIAAKAPSAADKTTRNAMARAEAPA